jgi:DNA-binding NarL/FixJ family response regulator
VQEAAGSAGRQVKELLPKVKLVYLTMNPEVGVVAEAFRCKASGYLLKTCASAELLCAIREVLRGMTYMSQTLCKDEIDYLRRTEKKLVEDDQRLSERQREVLQLLAEGKIMKEIADMLHMTTRTVAYHKYRMMDTRA